MTNRTILLGVVQPDGQIKWSDVERSRTDVLPRSDELLHEIKDSITHCEEHGITAKQTTDGTSQLQWVTIVISVVILASVIYFVSTTPPPTLSLT